MSFARIPTSGTGRIREGLPRRGTLADGRTVSGYHLLPLEVLHLEGWREVVDNGPPAHDPATHRVRRTLVVQNDQVVASYEVEELPPSPPDPSAGDHLDPPIGAPDGG